MTPVWISSLVILLVLLGAQMVRPFLAHEKRASAFGFGNTNAPTQILNISKWAFFISVFFVFFTAFYLSYQQYLIWQASGLSQLLLPPHQPIGYFLRYSIINFLIQPLAALWIALIALLSAQILNEKFKDRFFWPAEPWLFGTALLLVGHPGWIYYAIALFAAALLVASGQLLVARKKEWKLSFYYLWIGVAIPIILFQFFGIL